MAGRSRLLLSVAALAMVCSSALAYDKDTHFNLTYTMCRVNGMSAAEALQVASGDQGMDDNDSVVASLDVPMNYLWHSLEDSQAKATDRLGLLWTRAVDSKDPVKLGQYLHFAQDYFSHRKKSPAPLSANWEPYGPTIGHGLDGHNPDCVAFDIPRAKAMAHLSMEKIRQFMKDVMHRTVPTRGVDSIDPVIDAQAKLYTTSSSILHGTDYNVPAPDHKVSDALDAEVKKLISEGKLDPLAKDSTAPSCVPYPNETPYKFDLMAEVATKERPMKHYKLRIKTGSEVNAGTDSNIYVYLLGTHGRSWEYKLNPWISGNAFEKGNTDDVTLTELIRHTANQSDISMAAPLIKGGPSTINFQDIVDLGEIKKIHVRSDGSGLGPGWFLSYIEVSDGGPYKRFNYENWIESPHLDAMLDDTPFVDYSLHVKTGDKLGAGTDANVTVTLYGANGTSQDYVLNPMIHHNAFERNTLDSVTIHMKSIGAINKIRIRHDNSGIGPGWFLSYVDIDGPGGHKRATLNNWLEDNHRDVTLPAK